MSKKNIKSIKFFNCTLFILLIVINSLFYLLDSLNNLDMFYFLVNLFLLIIFFVINKKYEKEQVEWREDMKILNWSILSWKDNEIKNILFKKILFKENEQTYSLFKNTYVKKNLLAKDYEDLKAIFLKFIPEIFLEEAGKMWTNKISLWLSVKKYLNVMFLDIIWFTSITEKLAPDRALLLLNIYFDGIIEIIKGNWWFIDKFLWDGIMIIFDWKTSDQAIKSAIEIQNFMNKFQISEVGRKISVWIWINSWEVILWTIWSTKRMEITIIWDVVNTAARIEWLTRSFKNNIIISDSVFKSIDNVDNFTVQDLWLKTLKGKKKKIKIYGVDPIINLNL